MAIRQVTQRSVCAMCSRSIGRRKSTDTSDALSEIVLREVFGRVNETHTGRDLGTPDGAKTVLLTANTETVYALSHLALRNDGPTVVRPRPTCWVSFRTGCSAICRHRTAGSGQGRVVNLWLPPVSPAVS